MKFNNKENERIELPDGGGNMEIKSCCCCRYNMFN